LGITTAPGGAPRRQTLITRRARSAASRVASVSAIECLCQMKGADVVAAAIAARGVFA